jgi:methylated-DNA-[protein]-cysteine S-methyltransferase
MMPDRKMDVSMPAPRLRLQRIEAQHAIGPILIVFDGGRLLALEFGSPGDRLLGLLRTRFGVNVSLEESDDGQDIASAVRAYLDGRLEALDSIPIDAGGTPFQRRVWAALRQIPVGETRTYGQIAAGLGNPRAARAVGLANALNPISVVIPCHRLIGSTGALTGYGGGIERKRWLLQHEQAARPERAKTGAIAPILQESG